MATNKPSGPGDALFDMLKPHIPHYHYAGLWTKRITEALKPFADIGSVDADYVTTGRRVFRITPPDERGMQYEITVTPVYPTKKEGE